MKSEQITYLTDVALITCVVTAGRADAVIRAAQEMGAGGAIVYHARGIGVRERLGLLGIAVEADKEVVSLLVPTDQQDIVFEAVYRAAELDVPGAGIVYLTPVEKMATYVPREIRQRTQRQEDSA
ncbi:MAG: P-II family nitrogen regulator [Pseudomonadales bacterium]|jgi:nitrogen regulatory protein PII|nr:P-II family nitrogen regulator [Pseudomonadales bacterium]MBP9033453.1 P-II family nitrogen regulator [Pseudomonadales bacterium]